MDTSTFIAIITIGLGFIGTLLYIIYTNLNSKAQNNSEKIDKMTPKKDFESYKLDHNREHDKQDTAFNKLDAKLDKIIGMLLEGKNEK